jgi:hypothetical protein
LSNYGYWKSQIARMNLALLICNIEFWLYIYIYREPEETQKERRVRGFFSFLAVTPSKNVLEDRDRNWIWATSVSVLFVCFSRLHQLSLSVAVSLVSRLPRGLRFRAVLKRFQNLLAILSSSFPPVLRSFSFVSPFHRSFAVSCSSRSLFVCMFVCWSEFVSPIRSFAVSCSSRGLFVDHGCLFVFYRKDLIARALLLLLLFFAAELLLFR